MIGRVFLGIFLGVMSFLGLLGVCVGSELYLVGFCLVSSLLFLAGFFVNLVCAIVDSRRFLDRIVFRDRVVLEVGDSFYNISVDETGRHVKVQKESPNRPDGSITEWVYRMDSATLVDLIHGARNEE